MTRAQMAKLAQAVATRIDLPQGGRAVVVVTDESGEFVGVGSTTSDADTRAILFCAVCGEGRMDHHDGQDLNENEVVCGGGASVEGMGVVHLEIGAGGGRGGNDSSRMGPAFAGVGGFLEGGEPRGGGSSGNVPR